MSFQERFRDKISVIDKHGEISEKKVYPVIAANIQMLKVKPQIKYSALSENNSYAPCT